MDDDLTERLRRLGRTVADLSEPSTFEGPSEALVRARKAFVSGLDVPRSTRPPPRRVPWIPALGAAACFGLGVAGVLFVTLPARPHAVAAPAAISFLVGQDALPGVVGDWVAADGDRSLPTRFSDGSDLRLSPGARMRVTTVSPAGADVLIERGAVHASVAHPGGAGTARWAVRAGPFEVRVTGTSFDAAWDPMAETFELTMIEGRVVVSGPNLPPERAVVGGERLVVSVRDGRMVLSTVPSATAAVAPVDNPVAPAPTEEPRAATLPQVVARAPGPPQGAPPPQAAGSAAAAVEPPPPPVDAPKPQEWKELAARGKYRDAFAAAEAAGFGQEIERVPAGDLLMLADAARFSGSPARAREALMAARRRFGVRGQSAFLLGKIAADQQGSPGDAVSWFETYLREEPGGPLAEQALGRIVDLTRRSSPDAARRAAARYLARYPDGSYAALARSLSAP